MHFAELLCGTVALLKKRKKGEKKTSCGIGLNFLKLFNSVSNAASCTLTFKPFPGREQFHGLGSMYCRGAAAVILTYDVNSLQSLAELEDRFLALTDSASADCIFAIVGNKVDLSDDCALPPDENRPEKAVAGCSSKVRKQVRVEDAIALYKKILKYKMLDEKDVPAAEKMCFETSAKTGYKVDYLFETVFDMVVPIIVRQKAEGPSQTVDITDYKPAKRTKSGCCA